ncbi:tyrosine--tRNA ligase [Candidatus Woesearchaeota archaeon]|nr:tyrosine--tRNA ligase [Candidatus Woesearchaeota archaeon]
MDIERRLDMISQVGEEIITRDDLRILLETKAAPVAYDGFEPSGRVHIAQGLLRAINVNKMLKAGCRFKMWVADWHAWANNKMGGDLGRIQLVGKYLVEVWKACGMDVDKVDFLWANDAIKDPEYWKIVMQVARHSTAKRIIRCSQIMGRSEDEALQASQILYPCMQAADIFHLQADICQLGMDQRKVNMLAREIGEKIGFWKPVSVHHHMLMGLGQPPVGSADAIERAIAMKMSKSRPETAIFMTDTEEQIMQKITKAYCPEKQAWENPVMDYARYILFEKSKDLVVERPPKFGGTVTFSSYAELEKTYADGKLHPLDLKKAVAAATNALIQPVRSHFQKGPAKKLADQIAGFDITR